MAKRIAMHRATRMVFLNSKRRDVRLGNAPIQELHAPGNTVAGASGGQWAVPSIRREARLLNC